MKRIIVVMMALVLCTGMLTACSEPASAPEETPAQSAAESSVASAPEETPAQSAAQPSDGSVMQVASAAITDGVLSDKYGMRGSQQSDGIPTLSPPLTISNIPEDTEALAVTLIDPDGEDWIHWLCCFAPAKTGTGAEPEELPENASIKKAEMLKQGENSFGTVGYGGPTPPSGVHRYVFTVYALAHVPELGDGFELEKLNSQLGQPGMVLAQATVTGTYAQAAAPAPEETPAQPSDGPVMQIASAAITDGVLSDKYGMRGSQQSDGIPILSPPLTISNIPEDAEALAVTLIDPDGEDWIHWLCCFAPAQTGAGAEPEELPENASIAKAHMLKQGENSFGAVGYGGPTPPSGVHRYVFTVYALAHVPELGDGFELERLNSQLAQPGMVLAQATVTGTYAH